MTLLADPHQPAPLEARSASEGMPCTSDRPWKPEAQARECLAQAMVARLQGEVSGNSRRADGATHSLARASGFQKPAAQWDCFNPGDRGVSCLPVVASSSCGCGCSP